MSDMDDMECWAEDEFGAAELGDIRITERLVALAHHLSRAPHSSFPQSLVGPALKACYRFFDNPKVDVEGVLAPHIEQTLARMRQVPVVLAVQDTTEFNLGHLPAAEGLGYCTGNNTHGFMMHSTLAVTQEGFPLGVQGLQIWTRNPDEFGKSKLRRARSIEEKESYKWLHGLDHLSKLKAHCPDTHIISVCDREADIFDLFATPRPDGVDWLIRACRNRNVEHDEKYLWKAMETVSILGEVELRIPVSGSTTTRTVRLALRCAPLRLRPPRHTKGMLELEVFAIHAFQVGASEKGFEPLEWMLLSSVPTHTYEEVLERLKWYSRRWTIESWHRVLKSGCRIEARQFGNLDRFMRSTALFAVIAWRIMYVTLLARAGNDLSCEMFLQPFEWRALYCRIHRTTKIPDKPPSLAEAVLWIAQLGGYLKRKNARPPGTTVMWRGFLALHESTEMFRILNQHE